MFRGFTSLAMGVSIFLHAVLVVFLLSSQDESESVVLINVQYQAGVGHEASVSGGGQKAPAPRVKSANLRGASVSPARTNDSGESSGVSGESLGVRANYPRLSRVLGEAGQVQIEILKSQRAVVVQTSSGFKRLDESALAAVEEALANGALEAALQTRESLLVNFVFRLKQ